MQKILQIGLIRSWWVVLFMILCYIFFEQGLKRRDAEYSTLYQSLLELKTKKEEAIALQKDLMTQINSQSDPDWIELTLIRELGLVPEGRVKVYFEHKQ